MTKKLFLGGALAAIFVVAAMSTPLMAEAITDLLKTKVVIDEDQYKKIRFRLADVVPVNGEVFGGFAVFTNGDVIAVTSHEGAFDSDTQTFPAGGTFGLCTNAEVVAGHCAAIWHSHLVKPVDHELCAFKAIGGLTHEEPSEEVDVSKKKRIIVNGVPLGTSSFTESVSGAATDFTAGLPVDANEATTFFDGAAFDLTPVFDDDVLQVICIGDEAEPE